MTWIAPFTLFSALDYAALGLLLVAWIGIGWRIENPSPKQPSVAELMADFRREWMRQLVTRQPRIFDSNLIGNLRQSTAFFASATMIALGGGMALVRNPDPVEGLASDLAISPAPPVVWEIKLLLALLFLTAAFLKFVWANRLFGYCSVVMGAVPNDPLDPMAYPRADQAAELCISAARSFNRGLRTTYFALTAATWLMGPQALILATLLTLTMIYRREFGSASRGVLLRMPLDLADRDLSNRP
ncbi:DUF599 domain-containing protein [Pseudodonghicola flavimaris]|uniref:DUF599 domain-containing protein n=1 Tax=Pseudodonghicola flavimaris TaxID=3050036 RepID=A0ABT7EWF6_9RHOB|nr:DUF599 domain-containing protein [Pseudodonghicola flavimaris]MDK3016673.1 DUF599 domain-containing protein [Pseudodonghicola flavimaris]